MVNMSYESGASEWDVVESVGRAWWLGLLFGLISLAGGVLLVAYPGPTLTVIALLVGIELLIAGVFVIIAAFGRPAGTRSWGVLGGALALIAGVIVLRHPSGSILVVAMAVGIYLILAGVLRLVGALEGEKDRGWLVLVAMIDLALGIVIVAWPSFGITSLAIVLGIVLIVRGLAVIALAMALRGLAHHETASTSGAGPVAPAV
jgi:uncharacterized membrane protein HdeD (DUF308 family)